MTDMTMEEPTRDELLNRLSEGVIVASHKYVTDFKEMLEVGDWPFKEKILAHLTKEKGSYALRMAYNELDKWNDTFGIMEIHTESYDELKCVVEEAVHIGIQVALYGVVLQNQDGEIIIK